MTEKRIGDRQVITGYGEEGKNGYGFRWYLSDTDTMGHKVPGMMEIGVPGFSCYLDPNAARRFAKHLVRMADIIDSQDLDRRERE